MTEAGEPVDISKSTITSFADYEPISKTKENLRNIVILLFGIDPEKMQTKDLADRLSEDKHIVRQKYSLPNEEMRLHRPDEYYRQLEQRAKNEGMSLRTKDEYAQFFKGRLATAVYLGHQDVLVMDTMQDNDDLASVSLKAITLEHELIHALQKRNYPRMQLIRREYEAYMALANPLVLEKNPWLFLERITLSLTADQLAEAWSEYQAQ